MTTILDILDEYAQAIRGSWGDIDGRSMKLQINEVTDWIRENGITDLTEFEVKKWRYRLNICISGEGHWTEFCDYDEDCEEWDPWE